MENVMHSYSDSEGTVWKIEVPLFADIAGGKFRYCKDTAKYWKDNGEWGVDFRPKPISRTLVVNEPKSSFVGHLNGKEIVGCSYEECCKRIFLFKG